MAVSLTSDRTGGRTGREKHRPAGLSGLTASDLVALLVFVLFRLADAAFLVLAARHQAPLESTTEAYHVFAPTPRSPSYLEVLGNWDGQWYRQVAESGYPAGLSTGVGADGQSAWAFYPGFPLLCRVLMGTGLSFSLVAMTINLAAAGVACLLLHRLVRHHGGQFLATASVAALNAWAAAPILQVAYAESLTIALVLACLWLLRNGQFLLLSAALLSLGLTRPVALPMAVVVTVVVLGPGVAARMSRRPPRAHLSVAALVAVAAAWVATALWPALVWLMTGRADAYLRTQAAWPVNGSLGSGWTNWIWMGRASTPLTVSLGLALLAVVIVMAARPGAAAWGRELRLWALTYPAFVLLATRPGPSIARLLIPALVAFWPLPRLAGVNDNGRGSRGQWLVLVAVCLAGLACQYLWVKAVFTIEVSPAEQPYP